MANPTQGAEKLATIIKPIMDEAVKAIKESNIVQMQEVLVAIEEIKARMIVIEKISSEKKKAATKTKTEKDAAAAPAVEPIVTAAAAAAPVAFPANKLIYFRSQYKASADFRKKYTTDDMTAAMNVDETVSSKTKEDQKIVAMAQWCWNFIKNNKKDVFESIEREFNDAKHAHEAALKPPQQVVEPASPADKP